MRWGYFGTMKVRVFNLKFDPAEGFDDQELVAFCERYDVLDCREHWFTQTGLPWGSVLVSYRDLETGTRGRKTERQRDPRKGLDPQDRMLYDRLREWRSLRSVSDGVPPYLVFNNRQLADLVRIKPATKTAMGEISGIGSGKMDRYAEDVLSILAAAEHVENQPPSEQGPEQHD